MSEQLELLTKNVPHYENRSLLDDEQDDKRRTLARKLQSFVEKLYLHIDIEHNRGIPSNERELRRIFREETGIEHEVKTKRERMVLGREQESINVQAAWIDETHIAVIGLAYQSRSGVRVIDGDLVDQYKTLVEKWFITDIQDPLIQ
jgi:hypothetical protein